MDDAYETAKFNQTFANQFQQKVEMYFLALIFTVAGLVIQSAKFSDDRWQWGLEIAGWVCLVTAGIAALWRMRLVPGIFRAGVVQHQKESLLARAKNAEEDATFRADGQPVSKAAFLGHVSDGIKDTKKAHDEYVETVAFWGKFQLSVFCAGIVLVASSRAYAGLMATCGVAVG